jgi:hypothetical protein
MPGAKTPQPTEYEQLQTALDSVEAAPSLMSQLGIVCAGCGRERTLADDYDYTPLQLLTGRKLGWFNGDGEQMCGECLGKSMRGEMP